jgi:excisionase family DNA binding protein
MEDFREDVTTAPSSTLTTLTYTVLEAANVLRLSRAKVYQLIEREGLPTIHFGRAVRVPVDSLQDWLRERIQKDALPEPNQF